MPRHHICALSRSLTGERGLKPAIPIPAASFLAGRSLTGERGLKLFAPILCGKDCQSLPHGGAWIETAMSSGYFMPPPRRSLTGERGLKLDLGLLETKDYQSLPHGGAWIETPIKWLS